MKSWGEEVCVAYAPLTNTTHLITAEAGAALVAMSAPAGSEAKGFCASPELLEALVAAGLLLQPDR